MSAREPMTPGALIAPGFSLSATRIREPASITAVKQFTGNIFLYSVCYDRLCAVVADVLGRTVSAVIHQNQICIEADEDRVRYVFRTFVEYCPEETENYLLNLLLTFVGCSWTISVTDASRVNSEPHEAPRRFGVFADQHLIPRLINDEQRKAKILLIKRIRGIIIRSDYERREAREEGIRGQRSQTGSAA